MRCCALLGLAVVWPLGTIFGATKGLPAATPVLCVDPGGHTSVVRKVLFTPDGKELISVGDDKAIRFWNVETGQPTRTLRGRIGPGMAGKIYAAALSPDGRVLATAGYSAQRNHYITLWDVRQGKVVHPPIGGHTNVINSLDFSPDGKLLASGSADRTARLWETATGNSRSVQLWHTGAVYGLAFSPDGTRLATGSFDRKVRIWDVATGACRHTLAEHKGEVRPVAWSPNNRTLYSGGYDETVRWWDSSTGKQTQSVDLARSQRWEQMANQVTSLAASADDRWLAVGVGGPWKDHWGVLLLGSREGVFREHRDSVISVAISPDGSLVASADATGVIYLWDPRTRQVRHRLAGTGRECYAIAWSRDGSAIAWGSESGPVVDANERGPLTEAFDLKRGAPRPLREPGREDDWIRSRVQLGGKRLRLSLGNRIQLPDTPYFNSTVITRGGEQLVLMRRQRLNAASGGSDLSIVPLPSNLFIDESPDGSVPVDGSHRRPYDEVRCYGFTPDGQVVVGSSFALTLHGPDGKLLREFVGHTGEVWAVAISPDGRYLASASGDQTLRIWPLGRSAPAPERSGPLPGRRTVPSMRAHGRGGTVPEVAPLLSLFVGQDHEWIAWTPQGYYACSPNGEPIIGWHINRGHSQAGVFYHAAQFRRIFRRPDVIARVLETGDVAAAVRLADAETRRRTDPRLVAGKIPQFEPPRVDVVSPRPGADLPGRTSLTARVSEPNGRPVRAVTAIVNGQRIALHPRPGSQTEWRADVSLQPGTNTVLVVAVNDAGAESVTRGAELAVAAAPEHKPALRVLAVGVTGYQRLRRLPLATKDAQDFLAVCRAQDGKLFSRVEPRLLPDSEATQGAINASLDWLTQKPCDYSVVFLAGHGVPDPQGNYYFAPPQFDPARPRETGVLGSTLRSALDHLPGIRILVIDTCHAAVAADGGSWGTDAYSQLLSGASATESGLVILAACRPNQSSLEDPRWGNGAFTQALVEALGGKADFNHDGKVTLAEMGAWVSNRVSEMTGGRQQTSFPHGFSVPDDLVLARVP
jgi:WD40 repeat protein